MQTLYIYTEINMQEVKKKFQKIQFRPGQKNIMNIFQKKNCKLRIYEKALNITNQRNLHQNTVKHNLLNYECLSKIKNDVDENME